MARAKKKLNPAMHDHQGNFVQGHKKLGGMKKGSPRGRRAALDLLDSVLSEPKTKAAMKVKLRAFIRRNPVLAFRQIIIPLLPKETIVQVSSDIEQKVPIRVLWGDDDEGSASKRQKGKGSS